MMTDIEINIGRKSYQTRVKASWNTLSFDELYHIIALLQSPRPLTLDPSEHIALLKINIFKALTNSPRFPVADILGEWQAVSQLPSDALNRLGFLTQLQSVLSESLSFLFTTIQRFQKDVEVIAPDLTRCPMPKLHIPTKKGAKILYAPSVGKNAKSHKVVGSDIFANMTIYELGMSFSLYEKWAESNDTDTQNELLACIFREKKPDTKQNRATNYEGDVRLPLRGYEATIGQRKNLIALNVPQHIKNMLTFWFGCCRHHFAAQYPSVFSDNGNSDENSFGYSGIILELSRVANASKNEIADQNAHSTMIELMYEADKAKRHAMND